MRKRCDPLQPLGRPSPTTHRLADIDLLLIRRKADAVIARAQATGFKKIANKGESHSIALLAKYPKDGFPPFVYITGNSVDVKETSKLGTTFTGELSSVDVMVYSLGYNYSF